MFTKFTYKPKERSTTNVLTTGTSVDPHSIEESYEQLRAIYLLPATKSEKLLKLTAALYTNTNAKKPSAYICPTKDDFYAMCLYYKLPPMLIIGAIQLARRKTLEQARVLRESRIKETLTIELENEDELPDTFRAYISELGGEFKYKSAAKKSSADSIKSPVEDDRMEDLDDSEYAECDREDLRKALKKYQIDAKVPLEADGSFSAIDTEDPEFLADMDKLLRDPFSKLIIPFAYSAKYVYESLFMHLQITAKKYLITSKTTPDLAYLHLIHFMYDPTDTLKLKERVFTTSMRMDGVYMATAGLATTDGLYRGTAAEKIKRLASTGLEQNNKLGMLDVGNFWVSYLNRLMHLEELLQQKCTLELEREKRLYLLKKCLRSAGWIAETDAYGTANQYRMKDLFERTRFVLEYDCLHTSQLKPLICRLIEVPLEIKATPKYLAENPHMGYHVRKFASYINEYAKTNSEEDTETAVRLILYRGMFNEIGTITTLKRVMTAGKLARLFCPQMNDLIRRVLSRFDRDIVDTQVLRVMKTHAHAKHSKVAGTGDAKKLPELVKVELKRIEEKFIADKDKADSEVDSISVTSKVADGAALRYRFLPEAIKAQVESGGLKTSMLVQIPYAGYDFAAEMEKNLDAMFKEDKNVYADYLHEMIAPMVDQWALIPSNPFPGESEKMAEQNRRQIVEDYQNYDPTLEHAEYIATYQKLYVQLDKYAAMNKHSAEAQVDIGLKAHRETESALNTHFNLGANRPLRLGSAQTITPNTGVQSPYATRATKETYTRIGLTKIIQEMSRAEEKAAAINLMKLNLTSVAQRELKQNNGAVIMRLDNTANEVKRVRGVDYHGIEKAIFTKLKKIVTEEAAKELAEKKRQTIGIAKAVFDIGMDEEDVGLKSFFKPTVATTVPKNSTGMEIEYDGSRNRREYNEDEFIEKMNDSMHR